MAVPINPAHRLLLENGSKLLLEDGTSFIVIDEQTASDDPLPAASTSDTTPTFTFVGQFIGVPTIPLQDDFNDNSLDATKWESGVIGAGGTFAEIRQHIEMTPAVNTPGAEVYMPGVGFNPIYDLRDRAIFVQLQQPPNPDPNTIAMLHVIVDDSNELTFKLTQNPQVLFMNKTIATVETGIASINYNKYAHSYWRIRESRGTIYYDTSGDGAIWTNQASTPNPFSVALVYPKLNFYADNVVSPGTAIWDNFNIGNKVIYEVQVDTVNTFDSQ